MIGTEPIGSSGFEVCIFFGEVGPDGHVIIIGINYNGCIIVLFDK